MASCLDYTTGAVIPCPERITTRAATVQPKIYSTQDGVTVSQGQTTLDKILNTSLTLAAIVRNRDYIPTTQQPQQQPVYYPQTVVNENAVATENVTGVGNQIESVIQNNKGLIIVAGVAFLLLQMKPLSRR